jgi:hypothetical protein
MTARTKTALAAVLAALALAGAAPAFADPLAAARDRAVAEAERNAAAPAWRDDDWRRTDDRRRDDWRDQRPDYRNPNAFVDVSFRERFERLEGWISRGVDRGSLSPRDARWIWRQLEDTRALAISYRRSQGAYTVWEADEIDARLSRIRSQIRDQKRDDWSSWRNDDWRGRGPSSGF